MFALRHFRNEINAATNESQSSEVSKGKGDMLTKSKMNVSRSPAALLAAGRAMQEPKSKSTKIPPQEPKFVTKLQPQEPKLSPHPMHSFIRNYISKNSTNGTNSTPISTSSREPFRTINKPAAIDDRRPSFSAAMNNHKRSSPPIAMNNDKRPSPSPSPVNKSKPIASHVGSKMSDSNMFKPGPHVPPDLDSQKYCKELHEFAKRHSLQPPQFKTFVKFCPKTKAASYMCKVKMGSSISFTSCPYESNMIKEVQEHTAKIAYEELRKRYANLDSTCMPVTTNENDIIKRIAEIVNPYSSGLKSDTIESKYQLLHKQILPLDWLDIVKNRSLLSVEELMGGIMAVYPIEGGMSALLDVSKLPPLVLPENEVWNVYVTYCVSTSCVYFRIIHDDYNGLYAVMDEKMLEVYESKRDTDELRHVEVVKEGSFYAAYLDGVWFRVKALSTIIDDVVKVCLVDHGDIDEVQKDELFPLDERFTSLPAQKVGCSLTGLEKYSKEPYVTKIVSQLTCGNAFVARVDARNPYLQLTLLDTSTDVDIDVNELIESRINKELEPPKIPSQSNVTDAYLVSVKEDGLAYVQILSESFKLLKNFLDEASEELATNLEKYQVKSTTELLGSKIFLARYMLDGLWYRVVIDRVVSEEQIEVLFVDYGNLDIVTLKDIADVDHFTEALSIMPNQAVQVRLVKPNEELFTDKVLQFLMDLSLKKDSDEPTRFLLKTVKDGAIPDVHLFYRLPENNQLFNVNDVIAACFPEFRGPNHIDVHLSTVKSLSDKISVEQNVMVNESKEVVLRSKPKETLERIFAVPTYEVPCSEQFNVYVTMVSNPFNFIVQPQSDAAELVKLKYSMNEFYNKEEPFVDVSKIKENEMYAVKNNNKWFRGAVKLMNSANSITVKLVDSGEIVAVSHSDIAQLLPCFRSLPRQAIRAELAGITPMHSDWYVDDSLRFKELVSEKVLISVVVDILDDGKISIILYDTSTTPAIDVGSVLVQEGRAKDITKH